MEYEVVIGLEVHLQLATRTKAFCGCSTAFGNPPNSQTCPVCLGFPGSLPVLNRTALDYAIKVGLALNCAIQKQTKFDRKNYFYPDLPKNYQISQYDLPLARQGFLDITLEGKPDKRIGITRVHLEEDAGKLLHRETNSAVDFNRTGLPLLEIVSEPDIGSPEEAREYLTELKSVLEYLEVSDCDMEKGSLRCDANISLRPKGAKELGVKSELKNMNSFKAVKEALSFEVERQKEVLASGEKIIQETRLWDEKQAKTFSMRSKEEAQDYRYFPEPDLPLFIILKEKIEEIKKSIPELPRERMQRLMKKFKLLEYDATVLILNKDKQDADYIEGILEGCPSPEDIKPLVNLLMGDLTASANSRNCTISTLNILTGKILELNKFVSTQQISNLTKKSVLEEMIDSGKSAGEIIKEKNLIQISDTGALDAQIEAVIKENSKSVDDYRAGKANALMFLVGQVMKKTSGKANPKVVQEVLKEKLKDA